MQSFLRNSVLLCLFLFITHAANAQVGQVKGTVLQNLNGYAKVGGTASVSVCPYDAHLQCNGPVPLWADPAQVTKQSNPFFTDTQGNYNYYVAFGNYVQKVCFTANQCFSYFVTSAGGTSGGGSSTLQPVFTGSVAQPTLSIILGDSLSGLFCGLSTVNSGAQNLASWQVCLAAVAVNGGHIKLPGGTFVFSDTMVIPTNVVVSGINEGSTAAANTYGGTVIREEVGFPAGHPLVEEGSDTVSNSVYNAGLNSVSLDCNATANGNSGIGLLLNFALENVQNRQLQITSCGGKGVWIKGAAGSGATARSGPDGNWLIQPGSAANTNTVSVEADNIQGYQLDDVTIDSTGFTSLPTYGMKLSGSNVSLNRIHVNQSGTAALFLGGDGTFGSLDLEIHNFSCANCANTGIQIADQGTAANYPDGITITSTNAAGATCSIRNDATGYCGSAQPYILGRKQNGVVSELSLSASEYWNIHNPMNVYNPETFQLTGPFLTVKYNGSTPNYTFELDSAGNLRFGGNATGAGDAIFNTPYTCLWLAQQATTPNGLNVCGAISDVGNTANSLIANNLRWMHTGPNAGSYWVPGNGSSYIDGLMSLTSSNPLAANGGLAIIAQNGVTENSFYSQAQVNNWVKALFTPDGIVLPFQGTPAILPDASHIKFYAKGAGLCSVLSTGAETCYTSGGGGGGGSGNATSIQGVAVSAAVPANLSVLQLQSSIWTPTILPLLGNGLGTTVTGTTTVAVNLAAKPIKTEPAAVPATACGRSPIIYTSVTAATVAQAGVAGNFLNGCEFLIINGTGSPFVLTPSTSTISVNGAAGGATATVAAGKFLDVFSDGTNFFAYGN